MAWIGHNENENTNKKQPYTYPGKTDPNMLGAGNLFIRSEMVTCCWCVAIVDKLQHNGNGNGHHSRQLSPLFLDTAAKIAPYPRNCEKCTRAALCSEFLQRVDHNLNSATQYDPQLILKGEHTGWENLKWAQNYRNYRSIDSLEDAYPKK